MKLNLNALSLLGTLSLLSSLNCQKSENQIIPGDSVNLLGKSILVIHQDQKNDYWFGSWDTGLYKYDGETLLNYTTEHGLPNNRIDEIKEDKSGNIYVTSCHPISTISKFDGQSFTTLKPSITTEWKLQSNDLWFRHAFQKEKVYRYDGKTLYELQFPKPPNFSNPFEIYSIYKDKKGNIWFGTNPVGVCRYDGKSFDWITEEDVTEFRNGGANGVRSIIEDHDGNFWFNTEYSYSIYDSITLKSNNFYQRHKGIGALDGKMNSNLNEYLSAEIDDFNNLWFVTYRDGVWKYDGTTTHQYLIQDNSKAITLYSIYKDNEGVLWLGTHENGAYKFNGTSFEKFIK